MLKQLLSCAALIGLAASAQFAQANPLGLDTAQLITSTVELPPLDAASQLAKSAEQDNAAPLVIGTSRDYRISMSQGQRFKAGDKQVWQLKIQSPASAATSLHFDRFELAPDQQLWIYNPNGSSQYGPYTAAHRNQYGQLWSPAVEGETIVVELHSQEKTDTALNIAAVNHSYDSWWKNQNNLKSSAGGCNVDAGCLVNEAEQGNHPNHSAKIRATARMTYR
ncbi:MAG: hypothetical protein OXT49_09865, partial [Gammaproteobacteria bacterium]|nr:hypothetical protein [Gammaproteobacteria bacterium]